MLKKFSVSRIVTTALALLSLVSSMIADIAMAATVETPSDSQSTTPVIPRTDEATAADGVATLPDIKVGDRWTFKAKNLASGEERPPYTITAVQVSDLTIAIRFGPRRTHIRDRHLNDQQHILDQKVIRQMEPSGSCRSCR